MTVFCISSPFDRKKKKPMVTDLETGFFLSTVLLYG